MIVRKIISGGQTGVDIAATDTAIALGLDWGGTVPLGCRQERGAVIPDRYDRFVEHESPDWLPRTFKNVDDAAAALVLSDVWPPTGGTATTWRYAVGQKGREFVCGLPPSWHGAVTRRLARGCIDTCRQWILEVSAHMCGPFTLNIAGPRASKWPGGYDATCAFLRAVLA